MARSFRITVFYFAERQYWPTFGTHSSLLILSKCIFTIDSFHKFSFKAIIKFINCSHAYKLVDQFYILLQQSSIEICIYLFLPNIFLTCNELCFLIMHFLMNSKKLIHRIQRPFSFDLRQKFQLNDDYILLFKD